MFDIEKVSQQGLDNMAADYWNNFSFSTNAYYILKLVDIDTNEAKYVCGYSIEKSGMIYNFETNHIEVYPNFLVYQEQNMFEIMQIKDSKRLELLMHI